MNPITPAVPRPGQLPRMHDDLPAWSARARLASNDPAAQPTPRADDGLPLDDQLQTLLAGAVRLGESTGQGRGYLEGYADGVRGQWWWGFTCGGCAVGLLVLVAINMGRALGWWLQ